ncbi:MAG: MoaF C-terminal domain-containing protein [Deltaproteobacteria bacterium]
MVDEALRFIQVGELVKGISEGALPADDALAGRSLSLHAEDATVTALSFAEGGRLAWEVTAGPGAGDRGEETCRITRPRADVAVVDYVASTRRATAVTIVLDLARSAATTVVGTLPTADQAARGAFALATEGEELTLVAARIVPAVIDGPFVPGAHPHEPTDELVGKRVQYVYSRTEAYEHIYLNQDLYTWQCLRGAEQGLADTDRCHHREIGEKLYLFVWREKVIPTLGVVLVDWKARRSNGKLFGYEGSDFGALCTTPISSRAVLLNVTTYA